MIKWFGLNRETLQAKTALNKSVAGFWCERQHEMDFFTGGSVMDYGLIFRSNGLKLLWCFYQLFGLSFWRHPFTAEHPLLRQWCDATFLQIWWRNKLILILDGLRMSTFSALFHFWLNYSYNVSRSSRTKRICFHTVVFLHTVFTGEVFYDAVVNTYSAFAHSALIWPAFTVTEPLKSSAKLLRHGVVDDGVDGAVGVNAHAAEE